MPAGISTAKGRRSAKTKNSGKSRAKVNLPAKAGKRAIPAAKSGPHLTTAEDRNRAMWLNSLGVSNYERPRAWGGVYA